MDTDLDLPDLPALELIPDPAAAGSCRRPDPPRSSPEKEPPRELQP